MLERCFFPMPVPLKMYMLTIRQYIFLRKPCHMLLGKFVFCGCGVELVTLFVSSKLSNESFFLWLHYFWLGSIIIWLLLQMADIHWWILFFHIPSPHSSFISWHIVWDYLYPLFKQLSDNHQFKAELLKYSLECFWFPEQLYVLRNALTLMKLSSDPYHKQKVKKQPGVWTSTIPGASLGYEVAVFTTHLS